MNKVFYLGITLLLLSYFQYFFDENSVNLTILVIAWSMFMLGVSFVCEGITHKFKGISLLKVLFMNRKNLFSYVIVSTFGAILLEAYAQWLGKLWIYPYLNTFIYFLVFVLGFALYWLMIVETYIAAKVLLDHIYKGRHYVTKPYKFERILYYVLASVGIALIMFGTVSLISDYQNYGGYSFSINEITDYKVNFLYILSTFIGVVFVLELFEYTQHKTSFIKDLLHEYPIPFYSILIAFSVTALIMETENIPHHFWIYINWPYENIKFLGLPVSMFLAWPLHYLGFLSLFRAFTKEDSQEIWRGDLIK